MVAGPPPELSLIAPGAAAAFGAATGVWLYIRHAQRHVRNLPHNFERLARQMGLLRGRWTDINNSIDLQSATKQRNTEYQNWNRVVLWTLEYYQHLTGTYKKAVGVQSDPNPATGNQTPAALEHETGNQTPVRELVAASRGWPKKWYKPKFYKLASLDKDVIQFTTLVTSLRNEMKEENMTTPRVQQIVVEEDAKEVSHIPSHNRILGELRSLLQKNCKRIAIYGASQVGKTNILKNLNNGPLPLHFARVIWVTFPTHLEKKEEIIKNIQDKILLRMNLTDQSSTSRNADLISVALSAESYLLLFDGFSSSIPLNEIGIFRRHDHGKVIIETENPNRLRNVEFDGFIEVKCLPDKDEDEDEDSDSRMLFVKIINNEKFCNENRALVGSILKELGGHPGVIASTADWLKSNIRVPFWEAVKRILKADVGEPDLLGLGGQKNFFDITYNERLPGNRYRKCVLYAALFPKGFTIPINVLVECWKAEDFLSCPLHTFIEARGDGEIILNKLTGLYLLEYCSDSKKYIKMPINFRRVARHTPFPGVEDEPSFVRSGPEIDGHLKIKEWEKARRVSLMQSKLRVLPNSPKCERMSTLFLQLNPELKIIRKKFFRRMQNLRVLDLNSTGIKSLPASISYLTALRSLYLNNCGDLTVLPPEIVGLKKLEVLDIRFTSIHCVPEVMSSLVRLRCLRFSFVPEARNPNPEPERIFSPGTAEQLNKLEELIIVLVNGHNEGIYNQIEAEVPQFKIKKDQFELIPSRPAQSPDPNTNEDSSRGGRTGANSPARTKDKGKEQVDAIDRSKFSAGASTSGTADGAD